MLSIKTIINDFINLTGDNSIDFDILLQYTVDALKLISPLIGVVEVTDDFEIDNYTVDLPDNVVEICGKHMVSCGKVKFPQCSGKVSITYKKKLVDDDGYPLIPDDVNIINAILHYIEHKLAFADYRAERTTQNLQYLREVERLKNQYMLSARGSFNMPDWDTAVSLIPIILESNYKKIINTYVRDTQRYKSSKTT